jgi:hypothetical protein
MKAIDFLKPGQTAIVVFTEGLNLTIRPDGTGASGNWIINTLRRTDKIIIYRRDTKDTRIINEILIGQHNGVSGPTPDDDRRYIVAFIDLKSLGTTNMNWSEFAETGSAPVRYLTR